MYRVLILISAVEIRAKFLTGLTMILDGFCADAVACVVVQRLGGNGDLGDRFIEALENLYSR